MWQRPIHCFSFSPGPRRPPGSLHLSQTHLLLDALDLSSQPLDHPVELHDLALGVLQVIPMSAGRGLQLPKLTEEKRINMVL